MNKKRVIIVGLYIPGIYPKGDDSAATDLLAPGILKAFADADPEISAQYEINILSLSTSIDPQNLSTIICKQNPYMVAFSVYIWNYYQATETSAYVKIAMPEAKIIFGGPEVSYTSTTVLENNPQIDIIVCGGGETRFNLLLKSDLCPDSLSKIPSITYRDNDRNIRSTDGIIKEDSLKIPSAYLSKAINLDDGRRHCVLLETFRNCPFKCGYCAWGKEEKKIYLFPIEQVLKEIEIVFSNPNVAAVIFTDACIYYQARERVKKIIDKIASCQRNIPTILTLDIHLLDEELIRYLSRIELGDVWCFGMQSVNPLAIELMGRKTNKKTFVEKISLLRTVNPSAEISFNLIYGLPGDNYENFRDTVDFALSLKPIKLQMYPLLLLPGSPFWYKRDELGLEYDDSPPYMVRSSKHYSKEDMEKTFHFSMWYLVITYFPAIRDAILNIPDYNPRFKWIDLIDQFIQNMIMKVNPIQDLKSASIKSLESFNATRRQVFNLLFEPENCLHAYESTNALLKLCNVEDHFTDISIGIEYYRFLSESPGQHDEDFFSRKYGNKKIEYIKSTWVKPF
jgi:radical SAM superfamily enzyme YgiQ (UPF0313 family)